MSDQEHAGRGPSNQGALQTDQEISADQPGLNTLIGTETQSSRQSFSEFSEIDDEFASALKQETVGTHQEQDPIAARFRDAATDMARIAQDIFGSR